MDPATPICRFCKKGCNEQELAKVCDCPKGHGHADCLRKFVHVRVEARSAAPPTCPWCEAVLTHPDVGLDVTPVAAAVAGAAVQDNKVAEAPPPPPACRFCDEEESPSAPLEDNICECKGNDKRAHARCLLAHMTKRGALRAEGRMRCGECSEPFMGADMPRTHSVEYELIFRLLGGLFLHKAIFRVFKWMTLAYLALIYLAEPVRLTWEGKRNRAPPGVGTYAFAALCLVCYVVLAAGFSLDAAYDSPDQSSGVHGLIKIAMVIDSAWLCARMAQMVYGASKTPGQAIHQYKKRKW